MEYLGFGGTRDGIKTIDKQLQENKKYEATDFSKISASVYR